MSPPKYFAFFTGVFFTAVAATEQWAAPVHDHFKAKAEQTPDIIKLKAPLKFKDPAHNLGFDTRAPLALAVGLILLTMGSALTRRYEGARSMFAVAGFMTCSSMMLVVNKLAITCLPLPGTVLALQLVACGIGVRVAGAFGIIEVESLNIAKVKAFGVTPLAFLATLLANIKILEYANVETFIMVRNATPLATSVLDWAFLGRELPNMQSTMMLLVALLGSCGYVMADNGFEVRAYSWAAAWVMIFLFDQVYIKHIISTVPMSSWTRVYYNNIIAGMFAAAYATSEESSSWNRNSWVGDVTTGVLVVVVSCAMGTAMSYFAFCAREALSATGFTVVGNVCKVLSILTNVFLWDKHATPTGLAWLGVVIFGSAMYSQAPLRKSEELPFAPQKKP